MTATKLSPGDERCPHGGTELTSAGAVTYVCNGFPGAPGLVTEAQIGQIEQWAGRAARWKLCYKHSRDGVGLMNATPADAFHAACDVGGAKFFVAKTLGGALFGGYTRVGWGGTCGYRTDQSAFLFSLTNVFRHNLVNTSAAVYACPTYGPTMGSGHDFYTNLATAYCNVGFGYACRVGARGSQECYDDLCGGYRPALVDLEVYTEY